MKKRTNGAILAPCLLATVLVGALPAEAQVVTAPGLTIEVYANVSQPVNMTFGDSGEMYVGSGGESTGFSPVFRVGPGGAPVAPYGASPLLDPDAVLFDPAGLIAGVAGSVLVGGTGTGIAAILPDQSIAPVFSPALFVDVDQMVFDRTGRLLIADQAGRIAQSTGGPPTTLIVTPSPPISLAVDALDRIFLSGSDGVIRVYNADGTLANPAFAAGLGFARLAIGPGGVFGQDLYALSNDGILRRFDAAGNATVVGMGFDIRFSFIAPGPDGALYVSEIRNNRILRIRSSLIAVAIDIKPGSDPNSVNPRAKGMIPVAILTTSTIDALQVDPLSVRFGPNGAREAHGRGHVEDADGDGDMDLVLHFRTQETGIQCGATEADLTGETFTGQPIGGSDEIKTAGCR